MPGSILAHGDQADHFSKSLTCANTTGGGAATLTVRVTWNSAGCTAMTITSTITTAMTPTRILATVFMSAPKRRGRRGRHARGRPRERGMRSEERRVGEEGGVEGCR